jgi:predicted secreted protein
MPTPLAIAVFFTIWWVSLFAVLPFAAHSRSEQEELAPPAGVDRGAPLTPHLARAAIWTTALASVVFVIVDAIAFWLA